MAEENQEKQEVKTMEKPKERNYSGIVNYILIIMCFVFFVISYFLKFTGTTEGTIALVASITLFSLFLILSMRPALRISDEDYVQPPEYYYTYLKEHYHNLFHPRLNIEFNWSGHHMFYPSKMPEFIFLELYDKRKNQPMVAIIRVSRDKPSLRGLYKGSWDDFMKYRIYRFKMAGFLQSSGSNVTVIGANGQPVTMPAEAIDLIGKL